MGTPPGEWRARAALRIEFLRSARSLHPLSARTRSRAARPLPAGRDPPRSPRSNAVREGASLLQQGRGLGAVGQDAGGEPAGRVRRREEREGNGGRRSRSSLLLTYLPLSALLYPYHCYPPAPAERAAERNRAK